MKIEKVTLNRKFNLGNYETLDCGFEASRVNTDNPLDVFKQLEDVAELYLESRLKPTKAEKPPYVPKPDEMSPKMFAEKFPEDLRRYLTFSKDTIKTKHVAYELWQRMDKIARGLGYEYVSDGKNSRWRKKQ